MPIPDERLSHLLQSLTNAVVAIAMFVGALKAWKGGGPPPTPPPATSGGGTVH